MLLVHLDIMFNPIRSIVTENRLIHPSLGIIHHPILVLPSVLSVSWDLVLTCIAHQVANCQDHPEVTISGTPNFFLLSMFSLVRNRALSLTLVLTYLVFNILSVIVLTLIPDMSV